MRLESDAKFEEKLTCGLENNMRNFANFHQSTWKLGLKLGLLWGTFIPSRKYISLKFTRELCVMAMKKMQILRENWFVVSKMTRIWWILIRALKSSKNLHFDWSFLVIFDLKKCRGVIFHDTRKWCKIWKKCDLWYGK